MICKSEFTTLPLDLANTVQSTRGAADRRAPTDGSLDMTIDCHGLCPTINRVKYT